MKSEENYDDPTFIKIWLEGQKENVINYLSNETINFTNLQDVNWFLAPYISLWHIKPNLWIISGDLPTDYIKNENIKKTSEAVKSFADRWLEISKYLLKGEQHPELQIGKSQEPVILKKMGSLLQKRAKLLLQWIDENIIVNK